MKKITLTLLILVATIAGSYIYLDHPTQDRSSAEYHAWEAARQENFAHQDQMKPVILNPTFHFSSLELIYVSPGEKYYSWWGHILLHFVDETPGATQYALSFLADFNDFPLNMMKAIFGGYTVLPKIDSLDNYTHEYVTLGHRTMTAYPIHSTPEQNAKLTSILRSWILDPSRPGTYKFLQNSCVGLMNKLLIESGILPPSYQPFMPKSVGEELKKCSF